jgi:hypothetical protein
LAVGVEVWLKPNICFGPIVEVERDWRVGLSFVEDLEEERWG